jgi:hypothetical protein
MHSYSWPRSRLLGFLRHAFAPEGGNPMIATVPQVPHTAKATS